VGWWRGRGGLWVPRRGFVTPGFFSVLKFLHSFLVFKEIFELGSFFYATWDMYRTKIKYIHDGYSTRRRRNVVFKQIVYLCWTAEVNSGGRPCHPATEAAVVVVLWWKDSSRTLLTGHLDFLNTFSCSYL
jgi:hypothetical protein